MKEISVWYRQNTMLYVPTDDIEKFKPLFEPSSLPLDAVHPELWNIRAVSLVYPRYFKARNFITYCKNRYIKEPIKRLIAGNH